MFVLLLFLNIWRWTDTESDFYLRLKAWKQNKRKGKTDGTRERNGTVWNMTECSTDIPRIRKHSINFNLSKWFHLRRWDSQLLLSTRGSLIRREARSFECLAAAGRARHRMAGVQILTLSSRPLLVWHQFLRIWKTHSGAVAYSTPWFPSGSGQTQWVSLGSLFRSQDNNSGGQYGSGSTGGVKQLRWIPRNNKCRLLMTGWWLHFSLAVTR